MIATLSRGESVAVRCNFALLLWKASAMFPGCDHKRLSFCLCQNSNIASRKQVATGQHVASKISVRSDRPDVDEEGFYLQ